MRKILFTTMAFLAALTATAQRESHTINDNWQFRFSHQVTADTERVDLPHTWNAQDALSGKHDYKRGIGNYTKKAIYRARMARQTPFLAFRGGEQRE